MCEFVVCTPSVGIEVATKLDTDRRGFYNEEIKKKCRNVQVGIPEGESLRTRTSAGFWPSAGSQRPTLPRSLGRGSPHGTRSSGDGRVRLENGEFEGASSCAVIANSLIRPHGLFHIGYHIISYRIVSYRLVSSLSLISLTGAWHFLIYLSLYPWFSFLGGIASRATLFPVSVNS